MLNPQNIFKEKEGSIADKNGHPTVVLVRYVLFVLWYRRYTIIGTMSAALSIAFIYLSLVPIRYTATTTLLLGIAQSPLVETDKKIDPQTRDGMVQSQVAIITSQTVAAAVVRDLKLADDPEFTSGGKIAALQMWINGAKGSGDLSRTANETLKTGLKVEVLLKTDAVEIGFTSEDREKAATIANAIARAYIDDQVRSKYEQTKQARLWLQQGIAELRDATTAAFQSVQDFKSGNALVISGNGKSTTEVEIEQLTEALAKVRGETALAQSRLARITAILSTQVNADGPPGGTVSDALNNPVITKLWQQYLDFERLSNEYAARFGPKHEVLIKLQSQMAELRREMRQEEERIAETYKSDLEVAQSREQATEKELTEVFRKGSGNRQAQVKLRELETAESTYRAVYESFLNRYTQAVQQQSSPSNEARVLTSASVGKRSSPNVLLTLVFAAIAGANVGAAAAFAREQMHRPIYSRDQVARELGLNCIAILPVIERPKKEKKLGSLRTIINSLQTITALKGRIHKIPNSPLPLFDVTSEALQNIEVTIDLSRLSHKLQTLAIVSAMADEGKSGMAMSVAAMLSGAGHKVLLIDCDFRNPTLTRCLGFRNQPGILELMSGQAKLTEVINRQKQYGFDFLCAPTSVRPIRITNIWHSDSMRDMFAVVREHYDYIIVDLPPILPVIDVRAGAHLFDAFALVVEWGRTSVDDLDRAFCTAPSVRERLLGVVLNKVDVAAAQIIEGSGYAAYGRYV